VAQLVFDLAAPPALGRDDFFVSPANATAVGLVERVADWPEGKLLIVGPPGSGKTHLARIWAADHNAAVVAAGAAQGPADRAVVVENMHSIAGDRAAEVAFFHFHNALRAARLPLLMTAATDVRDWGIGLPDLLSRMQATAVARLEAPDDALLAALLVKLFNDRQIAVAPNLIQYLVPRIERSFAAAHDTVALLDARALALGRPLTRGLAAEVLDFRREEGE
jgi:chromosomal replication initiation ATPase DnaA